MNGQVDGGVWRHYKGGLYRVVVRYRHHETGEPRLAYQDIGTGRMYGGRPEADWLGQVEIDGRSVARFVRIDA